MGARRAIHTMFTSLLVLVAAGCSTPAAQDQEWVPCIIHCHSNYSDGFMTVADLAVEARAAGAKALVVTDHVEDIWLKDFRNSALLALKEASGWADYVEACREASDAQLAVVPGVEVGIGNPWDPYRARDPQAEGKTRKVHLLGIGLLSVSECEALADVLGIQRDGSSYVGVPRDLEQGQETAAEQMSRAYNLAVVIAHPWHPGGGHLWERGDLFTYYRNRAANVHGVEFFNGDERDSLRALGLEEPDPNASKQPAKYGVIAGSDYHGIRGTEPFGFKDHITWVRVPAGALSGSWEGQCKAIAGGIRSGHTVAGIGALQRGDTLERWLARVRGGNTAVQTQYHPFEYLPGRLIWKPGHLKAQGEAANEEDQTEPREALIAFARRDFRARGAGCISIWAASAWERELRCLAPDTLADGFSFWDTISLSWDPEGELLACWAVLDREARTAEEEEQYQGDWIATDEALLLRRDGGPPSRPRWPEPAEYWPNAGGNPAFEDSFPAWSPDGSRVVFRSTHSGSESVYTMTRDGSDVRLLIADRRCLSLTWSRDGREIWCALLADTDSHDTMATEIVAIPASGGPARVLTRLEGWAWGLAWSPDGGALACLCPRGQPEAALEAECRLLDGASGRLLGRCAGGAWNTRPQWVPGRSALVLGTEYGVEGGIVLWDVDTRTGRTLDRRILIADAEDPALSPDGRHLAFVRDHNIWVARLEDPEAAWPITTDGSEEALSYYRPAWGAGDPQGAFPVP